MAVDVPMICLVLVSSAFPESTVSINTISTSVREPCQGRVLMDPLDNEEDTDSSAPVSAELFGIAKQSQVQRGQDFTMCHLLQVDL